jgi:flagellar L-ring protein precursor FlgH
MKKLILLLLSVVSLNIIAQDMRDNSFSSLFSDNKALRLGDAITIIVVEQSQAANNAETNAGRTSDVSFSGSGAIDGTALPSGNLGVQSGNEFQGAGGTKSSGSVRTKISATIDSVYANGNMRVIGNRRISINGEEQSVVIKGTIRMADVMADNQVMSYNISDLDIVIEGSGMIDDVQSPGWLTKLFHWLF